MKDLAIEPGDLRHKVTLQSLGTEQDSFKDIVSTWSTVATYRALVEQATGTERMIAGQMKANVSHRVTMRYLGSTAITPQSRLLFEGRVLNIVTVNINPIKSLYTIYCLEGV